MKKTKKQLIAKLSPICFLSLVSWGAVAHAAIAPSAVGGPSVSAGANGSTIIDINTAGKGGVSHNIYNQFDVNKGGVVLNNSANGSTSQLAGNIAGNANLAGGSASIILNEVNSNKASQLNGMIEVAGQKAQVIVANPAGITCSGCGFINTERATLTTGKAQIANGTLLGYTVDKGNIIINGDGLKNTDVDYTDIISHAVKVNSAIHANDLKITVGRNNVNADNTQINELSPDWSSPVIGIDVAKLGGMYANKITMVSTDRGVGVRNAGTLGASVGDVSITTDGMIENTGIITAQNDVNLSTHRAKHKGDHYNILGHKLNNISNGLIKSGKDINIDVAKSQLGNTGGSMQANGDIKIISNNINNQYGEIDAKNKVDMRHDPDTFGYARSINNLGGKIRGEQGVTISSHSLNNTRGLISANAGDVDIDTAGHNLNNTNGTLEACCEMNLNIGMLDNTGGLIQSLDNLTINTNNHAMVNSKGNIRSGNNISIRASNMNNTTGRIAAQNALEINTKNGAISNGGYLNDGSEPGLFSGEGGMLLIADTITNQNAKIVSKGDIIAQSNTFTNNNASVESDGSIMINNRSFTNTLGKIASAKDTVITAYSASNNRGEISANGQTTMTVEMGLSNDGKVSGKEGLTINAEKATVTNRGTLASENGMTTINSRNVINHRNAVIDSPEGVTLQLDPRGSFTNYGDVNGAVTINK